MFAAYYTLTLTTLAGFSSSSSSELITCTLSGSEFLDFDVFFLFGVPGFTRRKYGN